ncbi:ORF123 [Leucania separata nucleopolyhedrovirus]|uniref:ORF123 n=1 Tax=Leucania separata nucleopolyhedrovirus TaxID=1307956 RepID=Q0IKZ6_NPVLS|nr:ORF123 [Leucania separata nucleopolyhedrovirus]AAR28887.1 ORF123 [Leucania separata nucleopolyhedrovirus]
METIDVDDFAKHLIAHKCSTLIEKEKMVPDSILAVVRSARDEYFKNPSPHNYGVIKRLFSQTKYVDDSIDQKNFERRLAMIAFRFVLNKSKDIFPTNKSIIDMALKRLQTIDPDIKSSPKALLNHYNDSLNKLDDPVFNDEHHLITFGKEVATKIFIDSIDVYSHTKTGSVEMTLKSDPAVAGANAPSNGLLTHAIKYNRKLRLTCSSAPKPRHSDDGKKLSTPAGVVFNKNNNNNSSSSSNRVGRMRSSPKINIASVRVAMITPPPPPSQLRSMSSSDRKQFVKPLFVI